jgi:signal transduction histidine kinase
MASEGASRRTLGLGIPADQLPHLFDRFWQGTRERRGSAGLGLTIVKGIVEAHGGRLAVESQVGEGTSFRIWIPAER